MSFDSIEQSGSSSQPFELYLFATGSTIYAVTNEDQAIQFGGNTYLPATIARDEIELSQEQTSGQVKIMIPKSHPIAALFIPYLPASPVSLTIYQGHYGDSEVVAMFVGTVASATFPDECELFVVSDRDDLKRTIPTLLYQPSCSRVFGDAGCGVDPATVTYAGTIASIDATGTVSTITGFESLAHSLKGGYLKAGDEYRFIVAQSGHTVTLLEGISGAEAGDTVSGTSGCAHTYGDCSGYGNVPNYLGFDMIPSVNPFGNSIK
jgi:uncharacterized phage protein (TIGR02218 family)